MQYVLWIILFLLAAFGALVVGMLAWETVASWLRDRRNTCRRCKNASYIAAHFCTACVEKIEKLIGEKW